MSTSYSPKIVTNGLVLALDAANTKSYAGSGTNWSDLSGNNRNVSLVNSPSFLTANNGVINLDGTNDHISGTAAGSLPSGTAFFTLSIWLYFNTNISGNFSFPAGQYGAVIFSGNSSGTMELIIQPIPSSSIGPPSRLSFARYGAGTIGTCEVTNLNMPIQTWHNLVLVRDGSASQKIYLNGQLIGTGNVSNSFNSGNLLIGGAPADAGFSGYINGRIANVQNYNKALSPNEVLQNFNATRNRFGV
jgi:hypothetical protein